MARVVVQTHLPGRVNEILKDHEILYPEPAKLTHALESADALLCLLTLRVDMSLLAVAPRLKIVANYAVGLDNVDMLTARQRGIVVTHTPGVLTEATADLTLALLLACARRLGEAGMLARSGKWHGWEPDQLLGLELDGATLGIVGLGRIGQAVAKRAAAFGMSIVGAGPPKLGSPYEFVPLERLLETSDIVSLHCPLTPATRHLLNRSAFERMKPGAIVINTARGPLIDECALADQLESGHLGGAGLDVFEHEPSIEPRLRRHPRVILAPHIGSATVRARSRMAEMAAQSIADFFAGKTPAHVA